MKGNMVTGVNSMAVGGGGGGALASAPSNGHSVAKNNNEMSGISIIEPVKRSGDNRRVSSRMVCPYLWIYSRVEWSVCTVVN